MDPKLQKALRDIFSDASLGIVFALGYLGAYLYEYKELPIIGKRDPKKIFKGIVHTLLCTFYTKDYDEAIIRQYVETFPKYYQIVCRFLIGLSAVSSLFMIFSGLHKKPHQLVLSLFYVFNALVHHFRLKEAFRETTSYKHFGRSFYVYYPVFDERNDFSRSEKLDVAGSDGKGRIFQENLVTDLQYSIVNILLLAIWASWTFSNDMNRFWPLIGSSLALQIILDQNFGPVPVFDALQRYAVFRKINMPLRSIKSIPIWKARKDWDLQGALAQAHFNMTHSNFKPYGKFLQAKIYKEKMKQGYTIGQAQAMTTLVRGATFMFPLLVLEKENTHLPIVLACMTAGYGAYGLLHMILEDERFLLAKDRDYRRNPDTKDFIFLVFQIISSIVSWGCFTLPLINLFFHRYGYNSPIGTTATRGHQTGGIQF